MRPLWAILLVLLLTVPLWSAFMQHPAADHGGGPINQADTAWMLTATGLVTLVIPGLALYFGGMSGNRNMMSTMIQPLSATAVMTILWVIIGFSLAFGDSIKGVVGNPLTFLLFKDVGPETHPALSPTIPFLLFAVFHLKFTVFASGVIGCALSQRMRNSAILLFMILYSIFIYAPLAHLVWHPDGLLRRLWLLDFGGGTAIHMSAGFAALAGTIFLNKRAPRLETTSPVAPNIPYVIVGTGLLLTGWLGFTGGALYGATGNAALALTATILSSASSAVTWLLFDAVCGRRLSISGVCAGTLVGLVAISAGAGCVSVSASIFIGGAASLICNSIISRSALSAVNSTFSVFPYFGIGAAVGVLTTGLFAQDVGLIFGSTRVFLAHLFATGFVATLAFVGSWVICWLVNLLFPVHMLPDQEAAGSI